MIRAYVKYYGANRLSVTYDFNAEPWFRTASEIQLYDLQHKSTKIYAPRKGYHPIASTDDSYHHAVYIGHYVNVIWDELKHSFFPDPKYREFQKHCLFNKCAWQLVIVDCADVDHYIKHRDIFSKIIEMFFGGRH